MEPDCDVPGANVSRSDVSAQRFALDSVGKDHNARYEAACDC